MPTLKKNENIKKYSEKKSYREPQLKDIGKVNSITKGSSGIFFDFGSQFPTSSGS